jgi:demethylmenaquinone methyltransferase/2-methoxy-6-polyprenyl-1,4-benzoquinol methylase
MPDAPRAAGPPPAPGEATSERVHGIFARIAGRYDLFNRVSSLGVDRGWRGTTVRMAELTPESAVLDLCAGTGDLSLALARQGRPASVVGTDFVPQMLEVAKRKGAAYDGPAKLTFSVADAQDLPFADSVFDVVTVAFGVRNLPDRAANFSEVLRVLVPGGRYLILEFSTPPSRVFRALYHVYNRVVLANLGALLTGDRASFEYLNDSILRFPKQDVLAEELRQAGFSEVTWRNLTFGVVAVHLAIR